MYNLGRMYYLGEGVAQDYTAAREWFEKAAGLGNSNSIFSLGVVYEEGRGVTKDPDQARSWYQKAADAGNEGAKTKLKTLK